MTKLILTLQKNWLQDFLMHIVECQAEKMFILAIKSLVCMAELRIEPESSVSKTNVPLANQ